MFQAFNQSSLGIKVNIATERRRAGGVQIDPEEKMRQGRPGSVTHFDSMFLLDT